MTVVRLEWFVAFAAFHRFNSMRGPLDGDIQELSPV